MREERSATLTVLLYFVEAGRRKIFAAQYSSMFEWATIELKMSDGHAQRRIEGSRLLARLPELAKPLGDGRLNLSHVTLATSYFRREKKAGRAPSREEQLALLFALEGKSTREAERLICGREGKSAVRGIHLQPTEEQMALFKRVRELWAHRIPDGDWSEIFAAMAKLTLEHIDPERKAARSEKRKAIASAGNKHEVLAQGEGRTCLPPSPQAATRKRRPTAEMQREVWRRDGGKCTHVAPDGRRCSSTHRLEFEHRVPFALGGESTPENLRLMCQTHNAHMARQAFGMEFMTKVQAKEARRDC